MSNDATAIARGWYRAFAAGDRNFVERTLSEDWFVRVVQSGDEVIVTYEMTRTDGGRGRNTEILTFRGEQISRAEVYFGWNLD